MILYTTPYASGWCRGKYIILWRGRRGGSWGVFYIDGRIHVDLLKIDLYHAPLNLSCIIYYHE